MPDEIEDDAEDLNVVDGDEIPESEEEVSQEPGYVDTEEPLGEED